MKNIKVFNIEFDGIDKCGKDTVKSRIWYFAPGMYLPRARGLISQLAYAKLYKRDVNYDIKRGYVMNTLFVLLEVDKQDWEIRCKLTNEPNAGFTYEEMTQAFKLALYELKERFNIPEDRILVFNTSANTPYAIAKEITTHLEYLNNQN